MYDVDTRRWSLRNPQAEISNHNIPTSMLILWARQGIIKPGFTLSCDGATWIPAEALENLEMTWYIMPPNGAPYGPITKEAAEHFIENGHFPETSTITQDPGNLPVTTDLPLTLTPNQHEMRLQEVEDLRRRLVLTEKELKLKDRRIEELRKETEVRQAELNIDGAPDIKTLTAELEALRLEHAHLKSSAQDAAELAATRENQLRQRIYTLEVALETAQNQTPLTPADESLDKNIYNILLQEAETLRQSQEEESRYLDQIRELSHQRLVQFSERLLAIRKLTGDSPEQMISNASLNARYSMPATLLRRQDDNRIAHLEQALAEARSRESDLQRQLVIQEGRETQLRAEISQAERRTLNSLQLDEKLRETLKTLEREQAAREEEHRENAHIQGQLLRRIEELERLIATQDTPPPYDEEGNDLTTALNDNQPQRSTFSWLRRR